MPMETPFIATIVIGLALSFFFALVAQRLRLPLIAGYLLAGIVIGPFTPGYVADVEIAKELAELGVILLMFGVGLHFSPRDLMQVRAVAVPGALGQMGTAMLSGTVLGLALGWAWTAAAIFGLALSVASTVVLLRALQARAEVETPHGRIAVGWLIVEDVAMVTALVVIPALAGLMGGIAQPLTDGAAEVASLGISPVIATVLWTMLKLAAFVALMLVVGARVIPWLLEHVANSGNRELFRLAVLAIALGVAYAAARLFGVSFALGAFFAGMVMAGSTLSTQAAKETLPLRDAFAVLFFVSVGMLFDPAVLVQAPLAVIGTVAVIIGAKGAVAYGIVRALGHDRRAGLTIAASLAQIGEFSFILMVMAVDLALVPDQARDLVVAGALFSILLNPALFAALDRWQARQDTAAAPVNPPAGSALPQEP